MDGPWTNKSLISYPSRLNANLLFLYLRFSTVSSSPNIGEHKWTLFKAE